MRLSEIYKEKNFKTLGNYENIKPHISFEVFPPKGGVDQYPALFEELRLLKKFNPSLVSLTWGAGGNNNNSMELVKALRHDLDLNVMAHFTCICNSRESVENHIKDIETLGIKNILALRGDEPQDIKVCHTDFRYANELVEFIKSKTDLSVGVAGYPEGHIEAPDLKTDIENLKRKVEAGAEAIYTQLFFDNEKFFSYVEAVRDAGINIPVIPGIMPVISYKQVERMTSLAKISVPPALKYRIEKYKDNADDMKKFGIDFASEQCDELIDAKVTGLHFYTLNKSYSTSQILENVMHNSAVV